MVLSISWHMTLYSPGLGSSIYEPQVIGSTAGARRTVLYPCPFPLFKLVLEKLFELPRAPFSCYRRRLNRPSLSFHLVLSLHEFISGPSLSEA